MIAYLLFDLEILWLLRHEASGVRAKWIAEWSDVGGNWKMRRHEHRGRPPISSGSGQRQRKVWSQDRGIYWRLLHYQVFNGRSGSNCQAVVNIKIRSLMEATRS